VAGEEENRIAPRELLRRFVESGEQRLSPKVSPEMMSKPISLSAPPTDRASFARAFACESMRSRKKAALCTAAAAISIVQARSLHDNGA